MLNFENLGLLGLFIGTFLAATIAPFSSDALYLAFLAIYDNTLECLVVATAGNWLGGATTYWLGRLAKWEWLVKWFKVKPETLEKQGKYVDKYGVWLALVSWVPIIGDALVLALGFYKARPVWSMLLMLVGKTLRFAVWTLIMS